MWIARDLGKCIALLIIRFHVAVQSATNSATEGSTFEKASLGNSEETKRNVGEHAGEDMDQDLIPRKSVAAARLAAFLGKNHRKFFDDTEGTMDDDISILLVIILAVGGVLMMTALLACYACIFRDLCCRQGERTKRRRGSPRSPLQGSGGTGRPRVDTIPLNDITQGESMPTESEKV